MHVVSAKADEEKGDDMNATKAFQSWLIRNRQNAELSIAKLAVRAGVSTTAILNIEQGKTSPGLDTAEKICKALGSTLEYAVCVRNKKAPKLAADEFHSDAA